MNAFVLFSEVTDLWDAWFPKELKEYLFVFVNDFLKTVFIRIFNNALFFHFAFGCSFA